MVRCSTSTPDAMEGSCRQPPNYRWCFSTYDKTCIGDFRRKASISVGSVPRQAASNVVHLSSVFTSTLGFGPFELCIAISPNQCRLRSTTSKPAMASKPVLLQHLHPPKLVVKFSETILVS